MADSIIPKEKFANMLLAEGIPFTERKQVVEDEMDLKIPEDLPDGDQFLNYVYNAYLKAMDHYRMGALSPKTVRTNKGKASRKDFIVNWIKANAPTTYKQIMDAVNKEFPEYEQVGKPPRTRINRVLKELSAMNWIHIDADRNILWRKS
jgi:hypothetical protein